MARVVEDAQHRKAAKKARQRAKKITNTPTQPLVIPGTKTAQNQPRQSRRWLTNENGLKPRRYSVSATKQVQILFHKDPKLRATITFEGLSPEAKRVVKNIETERAAAQAAGITGDWWAGERCKGVTPAEQKAGAEARKLMRQKGLKNEEMLGVDELLLDVHLGINEAGYVSGSEPDEEGKVGLDEIIGSMAGDLGGFEEWGLEEEYGEGEEEGKEDGKTSVELAGDDIEMADV